MKKDILARSMQNIINMNQVQMFRQFLEPDLPETLKKAMYEVAEGLENTDDCKKAADQVIQNNLEVIKKIEADEAQPLEATNRFLEDLRKWRRTYIMKQ